jgi:hypothetical protein
MFSSVSHNFSSKKHKKAERCWVCSLLAFCEAQRHHLPHGERVKSAYEQKSGGNSCVSCGNSYCAGCRTRRSSSRAATMSNTRLSSTSLRCLSQSRTCGKVRRKTRSARKKRNTNTEHRESSSFSCSSALSCPPKPYLSICAERAWLFVVLCTFR